MIIFKEKRPDSDISFIKETSRLYTQLDVLFAEIAQIFLRNSLKIEGVIIEARTASDEEILSKLNEIDQVLSKLISVEKKYKFNQKSLEQLYRDELASCKTAILGMKGSLNVIWGEGEPGNKDAPFMGTTSYKFIFKKLYSYMNMANDRSKNINQKVKIFNQTNKSLLPLITLPILTAPNWIKKFK
jgi:hypothetical protein